MRYAIYTRTAVFIWSVTSQPHLLVCTIGTFCVHKHISHRFHRFHRSHRVRSCCIKCFTPFHSVCAPPQQIHKQQTQAMQSKQMSNRRTKINKKKNIEFCLGKEGWHWQTHKHICALHLLTDPEYRPNALTRWFVRSLSSVPPAIPSNWISALWYANDGSPFECKCISISSMSRSYTSILVNLCLSFENTLLTLSDVYYISWWAQHRRTCCGGSSDNGCAKIEIINNSTRTWYSQACRIWKNTSAEVRWPNAMLAPY